MPARKNLSRWWDIPAALCLAFVVMTAANRLVDTRWTDDLERVQLLAFLGLVLGLALGQSRFASGWVRFLTLAYTVFIVPTQLVLAQPEMDTWLERLAVLNTRIASAASQFARNRTVDDSILFIVLMALLFWLVAISAGYNLTRHGNAWASILPSGILLFIINHYDPTLPTWARAIGTFLFFSLLLLGRVTYLRYRREWEAHGVAQSPETSLDLGRAAVVVVALIVVLAWNVPALAASSSDAREVWRSITHPWDTVRNRFSDMVTSLRSTVGVVSDFYGDQMGLGTGTSLGDEILFTVDTTDQQLPGMRYYWRARSYDVYDPVQGWSSSLQNSVLFNPEEEDLAYPQWEGRRQSTFTFRSYLSQLRTLYTTGSVPLWLSRPGSLIGGYTPESALDIMAVEADTPLKSGESYNVRSWVSAPTETQLRDSGQVNYPGWVRSRYLELPEGFSPRIQALAEEITAGMDNPYDKVEAITQYLRDNITYSTTIPSAPAGMDPLEWFLFDQKQGFCNYYASAEVMMLRSIGIPARMAVGFAEGEKEDERDRYVVRHRDAHAWPEVFFAGIGWVEFEPTVSQPDRALLPGEAGEENGAESGALPDAQEGRDERGQDPYKDDGFLEEQDAREAAAAAARNQEDRRQQALIAGILAGIAALALLLWVAITRRWMKPIPLMLESIYQRQGQRAPDWLARWARWARATPLERAYAGINRSLWFLGQQAPASATPTERADRVAQRVPAAADPAHSLVHEYQKTLYGSQPADVPEAVQASKALSRQTWKAWLMRLIREPDRL